MLKRWGLASHLLELNDLLLPLLLVKFERQIHHLGLLRIGHVDCFAAMAKVGHRLSHGHPERLRTLRPGVAIAVQADFLETKPVGAFTEPGGPHLVVLLRQRREKPFLLRTLVEDAHQFVPDHDGHAPLADILKLLAGVRQASIEDIHVVPAQAGGVGLSAADFPKHFQIEPEFVVGFRCNQPGVLLRGDGLGFLGSQSGPKLTGQNGRQKPSEVQGAIVEDAEPFVG